MIDLNGKNVLVTGGTGSFGQQFVETVLNRFEPERLIIFSRDEFKQYVMQQRFPPERHSCLRYFIGDVRDRNRLSMALRNVDIVIHAAAMKHVTASEYNPFECIHTNVIGAENVVSTAIENGIERVIALSTDKAANPVNLYGASKLASDKIMIAANVLGAGKTIFSVVRYGNVFGSRGSVIPLFTKLINEGSDHLPITDPRMTRFFISLPQGIDFVLQCLSMMTEGEIFVPKIPSMKITDIAEAMAPNLEHKIVGIRPGEKLHEVMVTTDDGRATIEFDDHYVIEPSFPRPARQPQSNKGGKSVPDDFSYSSDNNPQTLTGPEIRALLSEQKL